MLSTQERTQKLLKKGLKCQREGRPRIAEEYYRKALKVDPMCAEARHMLESLAGNSSASHESAKLASAGLGDSPETLTNRAQTLLAEGKVQPAVDCLRRVTVLVPESAQAFLQLGSVEERLGEFKAAATSYRKALSLQPDSVDLHCHLARVLLHTGAAESAVELYQRAVAMDPKRYDTYTDLGLVLANLGSFSASLEAFRRSLRLNPRCAKTIAGLGYMFECKGDLISASDAYRDAIKLDPQLFAAYADLGYILFGLGEVAESADYFQRLLALKPGSPEATANLGLIHLLQGNMRAGWAEYEARWKVGISDARTFPQPPWKGEPIAGKRIVLYAEQGFGDTFQFVRYVPMVAALGAEVVLEVQPALRRLLAVTRGAAQVMSRGEALPEFDWQCSLLSLPLAFGTEMDTIPASVPYIHPDPALVQSWQQRMSNSARRIGLVWGGNPEMQRNALRSIPLELLLPLTQIPGTAFYSLQVGPASEELKQVPSGAPLTNLAPELTDFAETAAAIANLDLVITIDSGVAHLAGGMGKPLWVLLHKGSDWRWFLDRDDSPWYPSARLFRQTVMGNWQAVVARVEAALRGGQQ